MLTVLLLSAAAGLGSALFPPVNIEAYLVGLAAAQDGVLLWVGVLAVTVGHMAGKLVFYALGRGWLLRGLPRWIKKHHHAGPPAHDEVEAGVLLSGLPVAPEQAGGAAGPAGPSGAPAPAAPRRWDRWTARLGLDRVTEAAGRPWLLGVLCLTSAAVGLPPFAIMAVLLGRLRMPVLAFLVLGSAGRLARFALVAGAGGLVLG